MTVKIWTSGSYRCVHTGGCARILEGRDESGEMFCVKVANGSSDRDVRELEREYRLQRDAWRADPCHFARPRSFTSSLQVLDRAGNGGADLAAAKGHPALLQERLCGVSLSQFATGNRLLGFSEGERVTEEVLCALCTLAELGYVHHDVHPGNILLCLDGTVRLIDLGAACPLDEDDGVRIANGGYEDPRDKDRPAGIPPYENSDVYSVAKVALSTTFGDYQASGRDLPDVPLAGWCRCALRYEFETLHVALSALRGEVSWLRRLY
jgi:serine/threonine protein kinase